MKRRTLRRRRDSFGAALATFAVVALALGLAGLGGGAAPAAAGTAAQEVGAVAPGAVVALAGTPHLWVGGEDALLHWAGDTRALSGRRVDWGSRREVGLDELKRLRRGDPWLSAGLLKSGDPIYFVKWETEWPAPQLLHIQSIADVELFGIDATNYGALVLDEAAWQTRFGLAPAALVRGALAPAAGTAASPATAPSLVVLSQSLLRGRLSYERAGWVTGELRNDGPGVAQDPFVTVSLLDGSGRAVATASRTSSLALAPGEVVGYEVEVAEVPAHQRVEVMASASAGQAGYAHTRGVPVGAVAFRFEELSADARVARASGTVTNTSAETLEGLVVVAWFLTDSGEVVDVTTSDDCCPLSTFGYLRPTTLRPSERAEFDVRSTLASPLNAWVGSARKVKALAFARPASPPGSTPAPTPSPPTPTPVPTLSGTMRARLVGVRTSGHNEVESTFEISGANPRAAVRVQVAAKPYHVCPPHCGPVVPDVAFGPVDAGTADASGRLVWNDRHAPYLSSHYTFIDSRGSTVGVDVGDDLNSGQPTVPNLPR